MKKSYYEILEIDKNADERQVKSAYFRLVRKYPPDRSPEEFKLIRAAYETLCDSKKRAEYDRTDGLPGEVAYLYNQVQVARREKRDADALNLLKLATKVYPDISLMKYELAREYESRDQTGNAIKAWEDLCELEPSNALYAWELAHSYRLRGWRRKAIDTLERTLALDPCSTFAWMDLIECHIDGEDDDLARDVADRAFAAAKEVRRGSLELYGYIFDRYTRDEDEDAAEACLKAIVEMLESGAEFSEEEYRDALDRIVYHTLTSSLLEKLAPLLWRLSDLSPIDYPRLRSDLETIRIDAETAILKSDKYPETICNLIRNVIKGCDCKDCENNRTTYEASILYDLQGYRPHLLRLKAEQPGFYASHSAFFDEVLTTHYRERLLNARMRKFYRQEFTPYITKADGTVIKDIDQVPPEKKVIESGTYRRETPKIGRNDPCPCGSGKKYKKCCGA